MPSSTCRPLADMLGVTPRGLLFTDLDGTVIDFETYECPSEVRETVTRLAGEGVATVAVTSKTVPEIERIRTLADLLPVAVAEGGAVLVNLEDGERFFPGGGRQPLVDFLAQLRRAGWPVRGLSGMTVDELSNLTGLPTDAAVAALQREASEPFVLTESVTSAHQEALRQLVEKAGFRVARGGRLFHLLGPGVDKGTAVRLACLWIPGAEGLMTGGCGDAWNDLPMLCTVDRGFLLGDSVKDSEVPCSVHRITERGPRGFIRAAEAFLATVDGSPSV